MLGLIKTLFGDYSKRELKRIKPLCDRILALEDEYRAMDEETLKARREKWVCPPPNVTKGYLARYAKLVSSANKGAIVE